LSHLAILGVGALGLLALAPWFVEYLQRALRQQLVFDAATVQATGTMLQRLQTIAGVGVLASLAFALLTSGAVLLAAVGAGGWIFSTKPITPQFNRLNPLTGFANLFSKQQLANVAKMVLMTTILSFVAWRYMGNSMEKMAHAGAATLAPVAFAPWDSGSSRAWPCCCWWCFWPP
jgi:flagellar biosynthetic protein FlhB